MTAATVLSRGLVLRRVSYSDTSQIVTLFTRDAGIVTLIAKGAHRLPARSSKIQSPFDLAGWYEVLYRRGASEVQLLYEGRLIEGFEHLRRRLDGYLEACFALEVMPRFFSPADPHPDFLRGALIYFMLLASAGGRLPLRLHFYSFLLREGGIGPEWRRCAECGVAVAPESGSFRVPVGIVCRRCRSTGDWAVMEKTVRYLALEAGAPWGAVPTLDPGVKVLEEAWSMLRAVLLHHLERPPRSLQYLRD
ncbi:MAG: DNA repair protein RecO [Planctomycetes bacterium]|nr:DNA repair protein RecO [Planctomycetota bacterium]